MVNMIETLSQFYESLSFPAGGEELAADFTLKSVPFYNFHPQVQWNKPTQIPVIDIGVIWFRTFRFAFSYAAQGKKNVEICEAWKRKGNGVNMYPVLVGRILSNPVYCGFYVWHKYETVPYCHGKSRRLKEREWCVQKGRQEAIISVFLFRKVQKIRGRESLV